MDASSNTTPLARSGHWPLLWLVLPIVFGYILGATLPIDGSLHWLLIPGLCLLAVAYFFAKGDRWHLGVWGACFWLGIALLAWAYWLMREPHAPEGAQMPPREVSFALQVDRVFADVRGNGQVSGLGRVVSPPRLLPNLRGQRVFFVLWPEAYSEDIAPGAEFEVRGRLATIEPPEDPYSFYAFLYRSGVYYSLKSGSALALKKPALAYERWARRTNLEIQESLGIGADSTGEHKLAGISKAMLLGRKEALGRDDKEQFIESGTMHLFAVSGLHIGIVATVLFFLFDTVRIPRPLAAVLGLALVGVYVLVVGHPPSAMRAYLMVIIFWLALAITRKPSPMSALLASAICVLLWNPQELLRPGFQLSYAVVGGILIYGLPLSQYLAERFRPYRFLPEESWSWYQRLWARCWRWMMISIGVSFAATLFSTPLTLAIFGVFTPGAIVLNAFLLPLASVALVVAGVSAVFGLCGLTMLSWFINHLGWGLNWLLAKLVGLGLLAPGLFHAAEWRSLILAPVTLCLMFLGYLTVLHLPQQRSWYYWVPPAILLVMLVPGLRLV